MGTNNGFYARNVITGESIEAAIIDNVPSGVSTSKEEKDDGGYDITSLDCFILIITIQKNNNTNDNSSSSSDDVWNVLIADWNNHVYRCTVEVNINNQIKYYPCSTAMFGGTEMSKLISTFNNSTTTTSNNKKNKKKSIEMTGEIIIPETSNKYGCNKKEQTEENNSQTKKENKEKIYLLKRGECSFEQKVTNYKNIANGIIILNNEPNHLFVMASSTTSIGEEEKEEDNTMSVL